MSIRVKVTLFKWFLSGTPGTIRFIKNEIDLSKLGGESKYQLSTKLGHTPVSSSQPQT